ncbi:MAG: A/G-specific adenine glycosylase [Magnetococcales bacterium]|nr:A/G-specific adenine glycosylase [Magnetococcales bacterium]
MGAVNMARALLSHYDLHARDLPWRKGQDTYRIWVAEIMLQQTGVKSVIPYFQHFLARFPDLPALAAAEVAEVLACWQGLGYYRRAVHLHAAARMVMQNGAGRLPETMAGLLALPGIGASTAGAILAIGSGQRVPILDGNVVRVLSRLLAMEEPADAPAGRARLWKMADRLTPADRPGDYAQAIMDLGARICRPRKPDCLVCPWSSWCRAHRSHTPTSYPRLLPRRTRPEKYQFSLLVLREGSLLLTPRPARGLLGGMWEPPGSPPEETWSPPDGQALVNWIKNRHGMQVTLPAPLEPVRHAFTHFRLTVYPYVCHWLAHEPPSEARWVSLPVDRSLPVSTLHRKVLTRIG